MNEAIAGLLGAAIGVAGTGAVTVFTTLRAEKQRAADRAAESSRAQAQMTAETDRLRLQYAAEEERWRREREATQADAEAEKATRERAAAYREVVAAAWAWLEVLGVALELRKGDGTRSPGQVVELQGRFSRAYAEVLFVGSTDVGAYAHNARHSLLQVSQAIGVPALSGGDFDPDVAQMHQRIAERSIDDLVEKIRAEMAES